MTDILKQKKILFGVMLVIVLAGAFRLFIYDSYRMPDAVSPGTAAISDGSTLTLDIPDSALPPGVTRDQIVIEPIPVSELPENLRAMNGICGINIKSATARFFSEKISNF